MDLRIIGNIFIISSMLKNSGLYMEEIVCFKSDWGWFMIYCDFCSSVLFFCIRIVEVCGSRLGSIALRYRVCFVLDFGMFSDWYRINLRRYKCEFL